MSKQKKSTNWFWIFLFCFFLIWLIGVFFCPVYVGGSPMREFTMKVCRNYLDYIQLVSTNGEFKSNFSELSAFEKKQGILPKTGQLIFVRTNFLIDGSRKEPVILSKQQFSYSNFRTYFGWSYTQPKTAFVVGYSDGSIVLLSQEQFTNINLNEFIPLSEVLSNH